VKLTTHTSTPPYVFIAWYLVKHRNNFTFTLSRDEREQLKKLGDNESQNNRSTNEPILDILMVVVVVVVFGVLEYILASKIRWPLFYCSTTRHQSIYFRF
jgi:uncharacterized ion transporter superfamily protein YfcC